jgi:hypothetical protein
MSGESEFFDVIGGDASTGYFDRQGYWVSPTLRALRELEKAAAA